MTKRAVDQEIRNLLDAPEIDEDVVALASALGEDGLTALEKWAFAPASEITSKHRAHALELLGRLATVSEDELMRCALKEEGSLRHHALAALGKSADDAVLSALLSDEALGTTSHGILLRALADRGTTASVGATLEWAGAQSDPDTRSLAAQAVRAMRARRPSPAAPAEDALDLLLEERRESEGGSQAVADREEE